jgi:hypothetical protein
MKEKGRYKLVLKPQNEINKEIRDKFIDLVNSGIATLPEVEKILQGPPYNKSHGTIYNLMRECEFNKQVITWQENGVTHLDIPPIISRPLKAMLIWVLSILILGLMLDLFLPPKTYSDLFAFLMGLYDTDSGFVFLHLFMTIALFSAISVITISIFWWFFESKKNGKGKKKTKSI